jgi:WhiB family transcriptional regulator, redox-sensing transcriptional regulator
MTDYATEWRAAGACLSADPDLFFPIATGGAAVRQVTQAQRICAGCGVRQQCLEFAMRTGETYGIWGGTTPEERIRVRRRDMRRRRGHHSYQPQEVRAS